MIITAERETWSLYDKTNRTAADEEAIKRGEAKINVFSAILLTPYQCLVQISCLITTFLSATRMIAVLKPLYVINKKKLWLSFFSLFFVFMGILSAKVTYSFRSDVTLEYYLFQFIELLGTGALVIICLLYTSPSPRD